MAHPLSLGIIPARLGSSRFPGKPLAFIHGIPMIAHVWARSKMSRSLTDLVVATCDREIEDYCRQHGMRVIMTSDKHERASDRCAEALLTFEREHASVDVVVIIQGDEPMLTPEMIDLALKPMLEDPSVKVVNLMAPLPTLEEQADPNEVKVVVDGNSDALYFSREPIPSRKKWKGELKAWKQVCIMPFRRDFLFAYGKLSPTPLEQVESVDMLRILEHGGKVRMVPETVLTYSVDTPQDLKDVEEAMVGDALLARYRAQFSSG